MAFNTVDVIIVLALAATTCGGYMKGFAKGVLSLAGTVAATILTAQGAPGLAAFFEGTPIRDFFRNMIVAAAGNFGIKEMSVAPNAADPLGVLGAAAAAGNQVVAGLIDGLTHSAIFLLTAALIFIGVRLIAHFLLAMTDFATRRSRSLSRYNHVFGGALGLIKGAAIIYLCVIVLIAVANGDAGVTELLSGSLLLKPLHLNLAL